MGRLASADVVRRVAAIADAYHPALRRDALRCYHAGEALHVPHFQLRIPSTRNEREATEEDVVIVYGYTGTLVHWYTYYEQTGK